MASPFGPVQFETLFCSPLKEYLIACPCYSLSLFNIPCGTASVTNIQLLLQEICCSRRFGRPATPAKRGSCHLEVVGDYLVPLSRWNPGIPSCGSGSGATLGLYNSGRQAGSQFGEVEVRWGRASQPMTITANQFSPILQTSLKLVLGKNVHIFPIFIFPQVAKGSWKGSRRPRGESLGAQRRALEWTGCTSRGIQARRGPIKETTKEMAVNKMTS